MKWNIKEREFFHQYELLQNEPLGRISVCGIKKYIKFILFDCTADDGCLFLSITEQVLQGMVKIFNLAWKYQTFSSSKVNCICIVKNNISTEERDMEAEVIICIL